MKTTLTVEIEYDPQMTDPEGLACAMDRLLETALSTPRHFRRLWKPEGRRVLRRQGNGSATRTEGYPELSGGVLQDVFGSDPAISVVACDWDVEGCSPQTTALSSFPTCAAARTWRRWPSTPCGRWNNSRARKPKRR